MPERTFPQTHAGMVAALSFVEGAVEDCQTDLRDRIVLVAGEALANAVEHGGDDPERTLRVKVNASDHQLELMILEAGVGIEMEQLVRSDLPEDPLALSGRGLFLIRTLADGVHLSADGGMQYTFRQREGS